MNIKPVIGVMSLQGCVGPHQFHIEKLGGEFREVRGKSDLENLGGIILPGGESTVILKLLHEFDLWEDLKQLSRRIPVWGICAGTILMARHVESSEQESLGLLYISVRRNAYGRQVSSFTAAIESRHVAFIRAPVITSVGPDVEVLHSIGPHPVWVRANKNMATTFHPELDQQAPSAVHKKFMELVSAP